MTGHNKRKLQKSIEGLQPESATNLWAGIQSGLRVFEQAGPPNNVQGLYVLTDGQPNHMCPAQGYVPKMKPLLGGLASRNGSVPTIHTFGFGYDLRSGLLQSIAEVGLGSYAFIPDAGMIGTVFIHAIANLYSTFATHIEFEIAGSSIQCPTVFNSSTNGNRHVLRLGNLHYGQSRDLLIQFEGPIDTTVSYMDLLGDRHYPQITYGTRRDIDVDYHVFRAELCSVLASFFPRQQNGEHHTSSAKLRAASRFTIEDLTLRLRKSSLSDNSQTLLDDLDGDDSAGQISKALMTTPHQYWEKWGRHYLPSLLHAHARQVCNSFKDPGPLRYGYASPLFNHCREQLDMAFDKLPAPKPSRLHCTTGPIVRNVNMSRYHNVGSSCFDGEGLVRLGDDIKIPIANLRAGMKVWSPTGPQTVAAMLKTIPSNKSDWIVRVGELWVTPWHPIFFDGEWIFPVQVAEQGKHLTRPVYSILLENGEGESHALEVGGQICVTMGHGILPGTKDVRAHAFFGNRRDVMRSLTKLPRDRTGNFVSSGVRRDGKTGLIDGFVSAAQPRKCAQRGRPISAIRNGIVA